jgi:hypothetical protein
MKSSFRERLLKIPPLLEGTLPQSGDPSSGINEGIPALTLLENFRALRLGSQEKNIVKSICYAIYGIYGGS